MQVLQAGQRVVGAITHRLASMPSGVQATPFQGVGGPQGAVPGCQSGSTAPLLAKLALKLSSSAASCEVLWALAATDSSTRSQETVQSCCRGRRLAN